MKKKILAVMSAVLVLVGNASAAGAQAEVEEWINGSGICLLQCN